ncbi:hypothetical protein [Pseudomonas knackmussii]|uniref:hypothetical protein n=1 Tax=Pseudomonas knackmussii TaxID=65741 RepID=UPI003F4A787A
MPGQAKCFISPTFDFLLIGGLSILIFFVIVLLPDVFFGFDVFMLAWYLAFFVNGPHFLISYEILYIGHRQNLFRDLRFFWAGLVVPFVIFGFLCFLFFSGRLELFRGLLYVMFFTVGWHYVKQAYGCFIVYSAGQGMYFEKWEQKVIRYSLFPLWWSSFLRLFTGDGAGGYWGLDYSVPTFMSGWQSVIYAVSLLGVGPLLLVLCVRAYREGRKPGLVAVTPLLAIYLWLSPLLRNDTFIYVIPFFHSLQYLLFSGSYTRGKILSSGSGLRGFIGWWGGAFVLAALLFYFVPSFLDGLHVSPEGFPSNSFLIGFILFINIHHYFIDSVIWRGDNREVREHLKMREVDGRASVRVTN